MARKSRTVDEYLAGVGVRPSLDADLFASAPCKDVFIGGYDDQSPTACWSGLVRDLAFSPYLWTPAQITARAVQ